MSTEKTFNIVRAQHRSMVPQGTSPTAIELAPGRHAPHQSILRIIWRRRRIVLLAFVMCMGAGVVYLAKATPIYTSSSRLLVEQTGPKVITTSDGFVAQSQNYLYTQCELLRSTPILSGATRLLGPQKLRTFGDATDQVAFLKAAAEATVGKADDIITVTLDSPCPDEAARIVNAIVESYVAYQAHSQRNTAAEILKILQREKTRRDAELKKTFQAAMAFKRDNEIISFGSDDSNIIIQRLDALSDALTKAELAMMETKARYDATRSLLADPRKILHLTDRLLAGQGTSTLQGNTLEEERSRLNLELTVLRAGCTEDHPAVRMTKLKLKQLEDQEKERNLAMAEAHTGWLKQEVAAAESRVKELGRSLEAQRKLAQDLNSKAVEYAMLVAEQNRAERICDLLDSRIKEIDITDDGGALNVSLLETARPASAPSKPKKAHTMFIAVVVGLLFGFSLALIGEWMDHRLRSAEEISEVLGLPVLGVVPRISHRKGLARVAKVVDLEPTSPAAEAYRTIRTAVYFGSPDIETRTLLVTSPAPNAGKTTLVSNLATAMAQAGQKVVILDADFRRPCQQKIFEIDKEAPGVTEVLVGDGSLDDAIQRTGTDGLDVLPCGTIPPNASEILNSEAFGKLLAELSGRYERVLIDAPPVLPLADARILGARCDAALLVLRADKSSRRPSQQAVESLLSVGTRILGAVVNGVARNRGYGYQGYNYYHQYRYYGRQLAATTDDSGGDDAAQTDAA